MASTLEQRKSSQEVCISSFTYLSVLTAVATTIPDSTGSKSVSGFMTTEAAKLSKLISHKCLQLLPAHPLS